MRWFLAVAALQVCSCKFDREGIATEDPFVEARDTAVADNGTDTAVALDAGTDAAEADADTADVVVDAAPPCTESGAVMFEGHCYFLAPAVRTFAAAKTSCEMRSPPAHLISITSKAEHDLAKTLGAGTDRWIGLSKPSASPAVRPSYAWTTGESSAAYDGWAPTDPDGNFDCARMRTDGLWADYSCTTEFASVCERD